MKKIVTLITLSLLIISCGKELTPKEKAQQNIEKYFLETAHDPSSYEFVKMSELDTIFKTEHYAELVGSYKKLIESMDNYPERIKKQLNFAKEFRNYGSKYESDALKSEKIAKELQEGYDKAKANLEKYQSLLKNSNEKDILEIKTLFECRANNKMGAKILGSYNVVLTDSLTVKSMKN